MLLVRSSDVWLPVRSRNNRSFLADLPTVCQTLFTCYHNGMLDKKKIKDKLEKERDVLVDQMKDIGTLNTDTGEWEAIPEAVERTEADQNDMADRFEDFEERSSMIRVLGGRLQNILKSLKGIGRESFGKCEVCKKDIEAARMEANPAARTCKKHLQG